LQCAARSLCGMKASTNLVAHRISSTGEACSSSMSRQDTARRIIKCFESRLFYSKKYIMRFEVTRCFVTRSCYCESHNGRPVSFIEMHSEQWEKCTIWEILMQFAASVCSDTFRGDVSTTELALASWFESKFWNRPLFLWNGQVVCGGI
jgi:hypothetical protein